MTAGWFKLCFNDTDILRKYINYNSSLVILKLSLIEYSKCMRKQKINLKQPRRFHHFFTMTEIMTKRIGKNKKGVFKKGVTLRVVSNNPAVGYVYLPNHKRGYGSVDNQISMAQLIDNYIGPPIYLDFKNGELVGIEIIP